MFAIIAEQRAGPIIGWFFLREPKGTPGVTYTETKELSICHKLLIPISLQPDSVKLWYFKLRLLDLTEFIVWNN